MTDILLINPPYKNYEKEKISFFDVSTLGSCYPPLGLSYVAAACQDAGYKTELIDMELEVMKFSALIKKISKINPKIIGITCASVLFPNVIELCNTIKKKYSIPIVIGGPHTFIDPDSIIKEENIDFVIRKEGEKSFVELLDYLVNNKNNKNSRLSEIKNLSYKINGKIVHNPDAELVNIDNIPYPARNLLKLKKYYHLLSRNYKTTFIITSRGCPFNCIFCNPLYKKIRKRSVKNVVDEIKLIVNKYGINDLEFFDETFNLIPEWVYEFCNELTKQNIRIKWRARCRPDLINEKMIKLMKENGCYQISLGIESANNRILKFLKKGYNIDQIKEAVRIIKKYNIEIHGYFIIGSPIETREEILNTINFAAGSKLDFASFFILMPYPGTELFNLAKKNNWFLKDYDSKEILSKQLGENTNMLKNLYLKKKKVESLLKHAYIKFYFNPTRTFNISRIILSHPITYLVLFYRYLKRAI